MNNPVLEQLRRFYGQVEEAIHNGQQVDLEWKAGDTDNGRDADGWPLTRLDGSASLTVTVSPLPVTAGESARTALGVDVSEFRE
jgi:hypothetical protein